MATIDAQVEANLGPFRTAVELIMSIPGIKNLSAQVIVSEIGIDMSRFPSAAHLISGLAYVRAMTRAPANVDPIVSVRALIGLRPHWFSVL
jgi:transposase